MKAIRSEIQMRIELRFEGLDMKKPPQRNIEICLAAYLFLRPNANGGISKAVMNDIPNVPIGDCENEQRDISRSLYILDVGTVSQTVRSGNGPYIEKCHARPAHHTVFSITQLGHSITQSDSCHHSFEDAYNANFDREMSVWYKD
jgi:hypothetical protein